MPEYMKDVLGRILSLPKYTFECSTQVDLVNDTIQPFPNLMPQNSIQIVVRDQILG